MRGGAGYWGMDTAARSRAGLPASFDAEVFDAMGAALVEVARGDEDMAVVEHGGNGDACEDLGTNSEPRIDRSQSSSWELANILQENSQHIHAILKDDDEEDAMEAACRKANELIRSLGGLVSTLNQFTHLIRENGLENTYQ